MNYFYYPKLALLVVGVKAMLLLYTHTCTEAEMLTVY